MYIVKSIKKHIVTAYIQNFAKDDKNWAMIVAIEKVVAYRSCH